MTELVKWLVTHAEQNRVYGECTEYPEGEVFERCREAAEEIVALSKEAGYWKEQRDIEVVQQLLLKDSLEELISLVERVSTTFTNDIEHRNVLYKARALLQKGNKYG